MDIRVADWLKAILLAATLFIIYVFGRQVGVTIALFIGGIIIAYLLTPVVVFLESKNMHRLLAIFISYLTFFGLVVAIIAIVAPIIVDQLLGFINALPAYFNILRERSDIIIAYIEELGLQAVLDFDPQVLFDQATTIITEQLGNLLGLIPSVLGAMANTVLVVFISIYMLSTAPSINSGIQRALPDDEARGVYSEFLAYMRNSINQYLRGLLLVMVAVGILSGVGVWIVGLPYPLLFGIWAGLTEIIPYLGPFLGAVPAVIVALTIDPFIALLTILVFVIVQSLESALLGPLILGGTIKLNPLLVLFALLAGAEIGGIVWLFLAVPILVLVAAVMAFVRDNFIYERSQTGPDHILAKAKASPPAGEEDKEKKERPA